MAISFIHLLGVITTSRVYLIPKRVIIDGIDQKALEAGWKERKWRSSAGEESNDPITRATRPDIYTHLTL